MRQKTTEAGERRLARSHKLYVYSLAAKTPAQFPAKKYPVWQLSMVALSILGNLSSGNRMEGISPGHCGNICFQGIPQLEVKRPEEFPGSKIKGVIGGCRKGQHRIPRRRSESASSETLG